jgi:hypothetical protein
MAHRNHLIVLVLGLIHAPLLSAPWQVPPPPPGPPQVNVTSVSAPGWLPSDADEAAARTVLVRYFELIDGGSYADAHAMQVESMRQEQDASGFALAQRKDVADRGEALERRERKLTWTKDPPDVPPGIYAAFDFDARFRLAQQACGYVVLQQAPGRAAFEIVRVQILQLRDAEYAAMVEKRPAAEVDAEWQAYRARYCPN